MSSAKKILVDRNVRVAAVQVEGAYIEETLQWGPRTVGPVKIHGYTGKRKRQEGETDQKIACLPTIARLVHEGVLEFYTYDELINESMFAGTGFQGCVGDLFRGIQFTQAKPAIERSYFLQSEGSDYMRGESLAKFINSVLLKIKQQDIERVFCEILPEFDLQTLRNVHRFKDLIGHLRDDDNRRDAFHLWTAEVNGLDYFLTMERRFINVMTHSTNVDLPVPPVSPIQLVELLGIKQLDELPLRDDTFYRYD